MRRSPVKDVHDGVRLYWNQEACVTARPIAGEVPELSREWFERIESCRYELEPFIHSVAQVTRRHGKCMLEIGVGAGTDHLQWAGAGLNYRAVDLTERAIEVTRARLSMPKSFPSQSSPSSVYSWGLIHHVERPGRIIVEVRRVLKRNGRFIGRL
jgi:2-polyprenyl-3-methyl-5-hydroxy-6-metoxy-1,4-benzoquinol methylase